MADAVQLTDLDVITRYSLAVRRATADRDELIETLRADLAWLERGQRRPHPEPVESAPQATEAEPPPSRPPLRRMPVKVTPARRKTSAKKAAPRKS